MPDLAATVGGISVIPPNAHIALARHRNDDEQFLRRPYNYDDAPSSGPHHRQRVDFRRIPARSRPAIHPRQGRLAAADALNQWITTIGSATFAILPGVLTPTGYLGQTLLESRR